MKFQYTFYIGDIYVGEIFKMGKKGYSVVGKSPNKLCPIAGFRTMHDAAVMLHHLEGYYSHDRLQP